MGAFEAEGWWFVLRATGDQAEAAGTRSTPAQGGDGGPDGVEPHGARAPAAAAAAAARRTVLLHGWLQSHACWLGTARELAARGHDVLLLDFFGHGRSPLPAGKLTAAALERQLREVLVACGWDHGAPLALGGLSLGGAVAQRYALTSPERVARLVLVCPAGAPEPKPLTLSVSARPLNAALRRLATGVAARTGVGKLVASHLHLTSHAPDYGVPPDAPSRFRELGVPLSLVWASLDVLHTPRLRHYKAGRRDVRVLLAKGWTHWGLCMSLDQLALHRYVDLWEGPPLLLAPRL